MAETLLYEKKDFYAVMTLNRPERLNAQDPTMQREFGELMAEFDALKKAGAAIAREE